MTTNPLRLLPSIKKIQDSPDFQRWLSVYGIDERYLTEIAKRIVSEARRDLRENAWDAAEDRLFTHIMERFNDRVRRLLNPPYKTVINGTGVVLHTNLGRARLSRHAVEAVEAVAENYSDLEFDLETGERGSRYKRVEELLTLLTGAEAAFVVNNNAAAVFLVLKALSCGREVIVSRGELVEIGGSFRVSSIMEESGAKLVEVGTTNKTHEADYLRAIGPDTAMILKVHRSNFSMHGFTSDVPRMKLAEISGEHGLIFYEDLCSGAFYDFKAAAIGDEPVITDILKEGVDIVSASGDKLFGGPQAGIILGRKALIDRLRQHQLARALRVDKMTLAALTATLQQYLFAKATADLIPTVRDITAAAETIRPRAEKLAKQLNAVDGLDVRPVETIARVGGGTMPDVELFSWGVAVGHAELSATQLARRLRKTDPAVIGRIERDALILDCRTITAEEVELVVKAFQSLV